MCRPVRGQVACHIGARPGGLRFLAGQTEEVRLGEARGQVAGAGDGRLVGGAAAGDAAVRAGRRGHQLRVELAVEALPQQYQGLAAQLRDAGLGDAQLRGDLRHRALVEEVGGDDGTQPLGQRLDRVVQVADPLPVQDQVLRSGRALGDKVFSGTGGEALQARSHRALHVVVRGVQLVDGNAEYLGQLGTGRGPAEGGGQLLLGGVDPAGAAAHRAAGAVQAAQLVEEGAADPDAREGAERGTASRVVRLGGGGQGGHPGGDQVVPADVRRYPAQQLTDVVADQRQVAPDEVLELAGGQGGGGGGDGGAGPAGPFRGSGFSVGPHGQLRGGRFTVPPRLNWGWRGPVRPTRSSGGVR